jgi:hypothetical protein
MKKIVLLIVLFATSSCKICHYSESRRQRAEALYYDLRTMIERGISEKNAREMFGCEYERGDSIFSNSTLFEKRYILVHYGFPISYYDRGSWIHHFGDFLYFNLEEE